MKRTTKSATNQNHELAAKDSLDGPVRYVVHVPDYRTVSAILIAPLLRVTGFRFSKDYRWGVTRLHRVVYRLVSTVEANIRADGLSP